MSNEYAKHVRLARFGELPSGFNRWELAERGETVAHVAAMFGTLPDDFDQWGLAGNDGRTVAHEAARAKCLPSSFFQWGLTDNDGVSVAHTAAYNGILPCSFDQWGARTDSGMSVLNCFIRGSRHSEVAKKLLVEWIEDKPACRTDADWSVFKEELPEIYARHTIATFFNDVGVMEGGMLT
jgi:hypothetical protein